MISLRNMILKAQVAHAKAHIAKHKVNIENYLENGVGVPEHPDIMEAIEGELEMMAKYQDHLDILKEHFNADV